VERFGAGGDGGRLHETCGQERGDHRAEIGVRRDHGSALEIDTADRNEWDPRSSGGSGGERQAVDADDGVGLQLGARREHGSVRDVVGALGEGVCQLRGIVRGDADAELWGDAAHLGDGKIVLADVHAVAAGEQREVEAIVGEEQRAGLPAERRERGEQREGVAGRRLLGAELQEWWVRREHVLGKLDRSDFRGLQAVEIDDGVEATHPGGAERTPGLRFCGSPRSMKLAWPCLGLALASMPSAAFAEKDVPATVSSETTPKLDFRVQERGPGLPWSLSIVNRGKDKARLTADPRLLWFEVKVPSKKQTQTCRLPGGLFPSGSEKRVELELAPGEGVAHAFDPRLYCFAAGGQWQLVPGAFVTPHFGWKPKMKVSWRGGKRVEEPAAAQKAPFVGMLASADEDDGPGVKELVAEPFALRSEYAEWSRTRIDEEEKKKKPPLELRILQGSDAQAERSATISIRLKNTSKRALTVYFRRELVSYEVMGPDGLITCDGEPDLRAPDRQAFSRLRPGGTIAVTSRLVELCPTGTFGRPGLYLVHGRLETADDGAEWDIEAFMGTVYSKEPATVRIRTGELSFLKKQTMVALRRRTK
jgi:hypothetical protein